MGHAASIPVVALAWSGRPTLGASPSAQLGRSYWAGWEAPLWSAEIRLGRRPLGWGGHREAPSHPLSPGHSHTHGSEVCVRSQLPVARGGPGQPSRRWCQACTLHCSVPHVLSPPQVRQCTEFSGAQLSGQQVWSDTGQAVRVGPGCPPSSASGGLLEGRGQQTHSHSRPRAGRALAWSSCPGPGVSGSWGWCSEATQSRGPVPSYCRCAWPETHSLAG